MLSTWWSNESLIKRHRGNLAPGAFGPPRVLTMLEHHPKQGGNTYTRNGNHHPNAHWRPLLDVQTNLAVIQYFLRTGLFHHWFLMLSFISFQHVQIETRKHTPWQSNMRVTLYCLIVQGEHSCQNSQSFKASVQLQLGLTPVGDFFGCLILSSSTVTRWSELYVSPHAHAYYIYIYII